MSTSRKIATNTLGQIILRIVDVATGVVTLGLITRYLGADGYGYYTTVSAFLQLFIVIIDFGLYLTLLRELSATADSEVERLTNVIVTLRVLTSGAFLALASLTVFLLPYPSEIQWGVTILAGTYFFSSLISTVTALFQKHLQMVKIAAANLLTRLILLFFVIAIVKTNGGFYAILASGSVSTGLTFLLIAYLLRKLPTPVHLHFTWDAVYIRQILVKTWPLAVTIALNLVYFKTDTVILSLFQDQRSVGLYGAAYRVVEILTTFPHMFMGLIMPLMTAAWIAHDMKKLNGFWQRAVTLFALIASPLVFGALVVGTPLMQLVAGSDFTQSGNILKILMVATGLIFFGVLFTYMVLVIDKQRAMIKFFAITAAVSVIGYLIFIPLFSYWGAAWITVLSELMVAIGAWYVVQKEIKLELPWQNIGKIFLAGCLMALITFWLKPTVSLLPLILIAGILYAALVMILRIVTMSDIRELMKKT